MKIFSDFEVHGDPDQLSRFVKVITDHLEAGWSRNLDGEEQVRGHNLEMISFSCASAQARPAADLWLAKRSTTCYYVANIVPAERGRLNHDEYNAILRDFYDRFASRSAQQVGARAVLGKTDVAIEELVSEHAREKLRTFSQLANKSTGSSHSCDQERWFDFLVTVHRERSNLRARMLERWFVEHDGWSEDVASDLAIEYETARALLTYYDQPR